MQHDHVGEPNMRARVPLYIAGFGAGVMGLVTLSTATADNGFALLTTLLLGAGFCTSWAVRSGALSRSTLVAAVLVVLLATLGMIFVIPAARHQLLPSETLKSTDLIPTALLAWLIVICSFNLTTDRAVLFLCVPSLSLIGLTASFGPSAEMLTYFVVFLALACFVLIQQNALSREKPKTASLGYIRFYASSVKLDIGVTTSVTLTSLIIGVVLCQLFYPFMAKALSSRFPTREATPAVEPFALESYVPVAAGPVNLSEREIMSVKCEEALLWRSRTFNKYIGKGWSNSITLPGQEILRPAETRHGKHLLDAAPMPPVYTFRIPKDPSLTERTAVRSVKQTFQATGGWFRRIFAAAEPESVICNMPQTLRISQLGLETVIPYSKTYTVISQVSTATPSRLRAASDDYPESIAARYLGTLESCWQVAKLAERVTAEQANPYDKAIAIERYLEANYTYDTNPPPTPEDDDVVSHFLLTSRRGYCDVFASAMVIMCRQVGVPARWATGFAAGEFNPNDGVYHVRDKDRHAWAEVCFPDYGWIAFDPSPMRSESTHLATRLRKLWAGSIGTLRSNYFTIVGGLVILLLAGYLVKMEVICRTRAKGQATGTYAKFDNAEISDCYRRMCELLARFGYPRHPSATPWEYAAWLGGIFRPDLKNLSAAVDSVTADFVEYRYAGRELSPEKVSAAARMLRTLPPHLRAARRQKLLPQQ